MAGVPQMRSRAGAGEGGPGVLADAPRAAGVGAALRRAGAGGPHSAEDGARLAVGAFFGCRLSGGFGAVG